MYIYWYWTWCICFFNQLKSMRAYFTCILYNSLSKLLLSRQRLKERLLTHWNAEYNCKSKWCFFQYYWFLITLVFMLNSFCVFESSVAFEKAYCEYRLNRTQEALSTLRKIPQPDTRAKELLSQVVRRIFI